MKQFSQIIIQKILLDIETIKKFMPRSRVFLQEDGIDIQLVTDSSRTYKIKVLLGSSYPIQKPRVILISPKDLICHDGKPLSTKAGHSYHINGKHPLGLDICHIRYWTSQMGIYQIAVKCLLYFMAYERTLQTGHTISYYTG